METNYQTDSTTADQQDEAMQRLAIATATGKTVRSRGPLEWQMYLAWGLWILVFVPPFDFISANVWGPIIGTAAVVGWLLHVLYIYRRRQRVHTTRRSRWWLWLAVISTWYVALVIAANIVHNHVRFAFTLATILAVIPYFVTAAVLYRRESHVSS